MTPQMLEHFRALLLEERSAILARSQETIKYGLALSSDDMPDENDLASALYDQGFTLRLRDRERHLLRKIARALVRIDEGEYPYCQDCDDEIDPRRLEVRPVTTLCIDCKENSERSEGQVAEVIPLRARQNFYSRDDEDDASDDETLDPIPITATLLGTEDEDGEDLSLETAEG